MWVLSYGLAHFGLGRAELKVHLEGGE